MRGQAENAGLQRSATPSRQAPYRAVRAPAVVVAAYPGTPRDLFPWLTEPLTDARTRAADEARLTRALPGSRLLRLHDANHADCFIEYEAAVLQALEGMRW